MRTALEDGQIPKDIFNDQLALGKRPQTHPQLRYKDICERDMKALDINTEIWEDTAANRNSWRCLLKTLLKTGEEKILILNLAERGEPGRRHTDPANPPPPTSNYVCTLCSRDCHSRIGLTRQTKALKGSKKPILICFGIFLVFKLARTYHKLDKYAKKYFLSQAL